MHRGHRLSDECHRRAVGEIDFRLCIEHSAYCVCKAQDICRLTGAYIVDRGGDVRALHCLYQAPNHVCHVDKVPLLAAVAEDRDWFASTDPVAED